MFNFFTNKSNQDSEKTKKNEPEWLDSLKENEKRYEIFLSKLEAKAVELTEAALPELLALKAKDEQQHYLMLNGILGQLKNIRDKASDVYDDKIENVYQNLKSQVDVLNPYYQRLTEFRIVSSDRLQNGLEEKISKLRDQLTNTNYTDYEIVYQQILDEHEQIKDTFKCQQCGDAIPLIKIYFVTTHIACPSCQNKNTFTPSTLAKGLEHITRSLAEQRAQPLLDKYHVEQQRENDLYMKAHQLRLKQSFDKKDAALEQEIEATVAEHHQSKALIPQYYQTYQRTMFDEWKKLIPDLSEQIEKFYESQQKKN